MTGWCNVYGHPQGIHECSVFSAVEAPSVSLGFIDPASIPESDVIGIDSVTCRCGGLTLGPIRSTIPSAVAAKAMCPNCGDWIEPLTQPSDDAARPSVSGTEGDGFDG